MTPCASDRDIPEPRQAEVRDPGLEPGYLTEGMPGIGGTLRDSPSDFCVEEIPCYGPSGEGQHTLFEIEKRGIDTMEAIRRIASALDVPGGHVGCAGLKDAHAITRQHLSVESVSPQALRRLDLPDVTVLWAERHRNRLKIGHLRGNHFRIRIRGVPTEAAAQAGAILAVLERRGLPNGFGYQRFGVRQNTHLLGRALVWRDFDSFVRLFLGSPRPKDPAGAHAARQLAEEGDYHRALARWPRNLRPERSVLASLASGHDPPTALQSLPSRLRRLFVAAYQSYLFNLLLADRLQRIDVIERGDLAIKHQTGAFFTVEDPGIEQPRVDHLEISPSGPLFGHRCRLAQGDPGMRERAVLSREGLDLELWRGAGGATLRGERRAYRVPISDAKVGYDDGVVLTFTLPSGAFATNLLAEVTKAG